MRTATANIAPIETRYAGCRFRSRLEARWAVFFDVLDIQWEYEPEAYALPSGGYLPDFRLTLERESEAVWFEVKAPNAESDERWSELGALTHLKVFVAFGMFLPDGPCVHGAIELHHHGYDEGYAFCICSCGRVGIEFNGRAERICGERCVPIDQWNNANDPALMHAFQQALSARFGK
jgi:hypothetical protein